MDESSSELRRTSRPARESPTLRVLIIDDDPAYRAYVAALAKRHGWIGATAPDGEAALAVLDRETFDLLLVDYQMPRLDGMQFIEHLRADERLRGTYAIMLTSRGDLDTKIAALTAGFDDFLPKTAAEDEIAAKLLATRRVLARQQNLSADVRRLYGLATRDELTGVWNRRFFLDETARLLEEGVPVHLVLFDLDDFKAINDTHGHLTGDHVLRDIGALFHAATRPEDLIARYGGDEFVLVVTRLPLPVVERVTARLIHGIAELSWSAGASTFGMTATTGMAASGLLPSPTVEKLLNAADRDLYKNKWLRKNPNESIDAFDALPPRAEIIVAEPASLPFRARNRERT